MKKVTRARKPAFLRGGGHNKKRLANKWRKPRGWSSKRRQKLHGHVVVNPGYGSPREIRGLHNSGLEIIYVSSLEQISNLNPKKQGVVVSAGLGKRKKLQIINQLLKSKIKVLNIRNPEEYLKSIAQEIESKKKKEEKKPEKKEIAPKKESIEDKLSEEEKKKIEKKEIDRLLTKKF